MWHYTKKYDRISVFNRRKRRIVIKTDLLLNKIISSIVEIILLSLIPFIWWAVTARKEIRFTQWIGLKKIEKENRAGTIKTVICITIPCFMISLLILYMLRGAASAAADFEGKGMSVFPAAFVHAFFNTALPEEILFRGFLLKRIKNKFGFRAANAIQSILFGALHGVLFLSLAGIGMFKTIIVTVFTGVTAWLTGYTNEKKANGSILPGWIMHGIANTVSAAVSMFSII